MKPSNFMEMFYHHNDDYIIKNLTILLDTGKININDTTTYNVNYVTGNYEMKDYSLLHLACLFERVEIVQFLLNRSADVNAKTFVSGTPLYIVIMNSNICIAKLLIDNGADINIKYNNGNTLIMEAIINSSLEMLCFLFDYCVDINSSLNICDMVTMTPLLFAVRYPRVDVVRMLINKGADVNSYIPENTETALHRLSIDKFRFSVEERNNFNCIADLLIKSGANINAPNSDGESPLCVAARRIDCSLVELFVKHGSDLNMIFYDDDAIRTPFHLITAKIKKPKFIDLCLKYGADYRIIDGCSAYHLALLNYNNDDDTNYYTNDDTDDDTYDGTNDDNNDNTKEYDEAIRIFWKYGCPFDLLSGSSYDECTTIFLHKFVHGTDANVPNIIKYQRLMFEGIKSNNIKSVKDAIKFGAVARGTSMDIQYPLHFVSVKGYTDVAKVLLENGIKVNNLNDKSETALQLAIRFREINICKLLFQHGACLNFKVEIRNLASHDDEPSKKVKELLTSVYSWFILVKQGNCLIFDLMRDLLNTDDEMFLTHLNALDKNKRSLTALAMYYGHAEIVEEIMKNRLSYRQKLLKLPGL